MAAPGLFFFFFFFFFLPFAFKLEPLGALFALVRQWPLRSSIFFYSIGYYARNRERNQTRF